MRVVGTFIAFNGEVCDVE